MTDDNTTTPTEASTLAHVIQQQLTMLNLLNARLVRIETRQARHMLDVGIPLNKEVNHADA